HKEKSNFFGQAKALLYPIEWHEPFGLNMVESMACGTPVIAFKMGSVPEVVKNGKTGFVVSNIKEAVEAIKNIDQIKREDCRKWVEERFSAERMVSDYEKLYFKLLK
ncbi:MAG: glycosyltransferase, partial [Minisyncoccales bacterium]